MAWMEAQITLMALNNSNTITSLTNKSNFEHLDATWKRKESRETRVCADSYMVNKGWPHTIGSDLLQLNNQTFNNLLLNIFYERQVILLHASKASQIWYPTYFCYIWNQKWLGNMKQLALTLVRTPIVSFMPSSHYNCVWIVSIMWQTL